MPTYSKRLTARARASAPPTMPTPMTTEARPPTKVIQRVRCSARDRSHNGLSSSAGSSPLVIDARYRSGAWPAGNWAVTAGLTAGYRAWTSPTGVEHPSPIPALV